MAPPDAAPAIDHSLALGNPSISALRAIHLLAGEVERAARGREALQKLQFRSLWLQFVHPIVALCASPALALSSIQGQGAGHVAVAIAAAGYHGRLLVVDSLVPLLLDTLRRLGALAVRAGNSSSSSGSSSSRDKDEAEAMAALGLLLRLVMQVPASNVDSAEGEGEEKERVHRPLARWAAEMVSVLMPWAGGGTSGGDSDQSGLNGHTHDDHEEGRGGGGWCGQGTSTDEAAGGGCCGGHDHSHAAHAHIQIPITEARLPSATTAPSSSNSSSSGLTGAQRASAQLAIQCLSSLYARCSGAPALGQCVALLGRVAIYGESALGVGGGEAFFVQGGIGGGIGHGGGSSGSSKAQALLVGAATAGLTLLSGKFASAVASMQQALFVEIRERLGPGLGLEEARGGMRVLAFMGTSFRYLFPFLPESKIIHPYHHFF